MTTDTIRKLADMTDEGLFESLATTVLRYSDDRRSSLSHPGVNADGKTVKSPVDGIAFVPGAVPPQMIAVHHTICAAKGLEKKWLHDPAKVKSRGRGKPPTAPAGDVMKTIEIINEEKERTPSLQATLILTTNQEPGENLVRDVHAAGASAGIAIDIWSRSRLADFLDNEPRGQWLRRQFLGTDQVLLSEEMLSELSRKSLEVCCPPDEPEAWVERALDVAIEEAREEQVVFVIAESGSGKTVACYKRLLANSLAGGFSLIVTDEAIESSLSLEQAVEKALTQLHPSLMAGCGGAALQLSNPNRRLLLTVEDINRSGRGAALIEKISRWDSVKNKGDGESSWQLLCPVWPKVMSSLGEEARRRVNNRAVAGTVFSADEGAKAVKLRRELSGRPVSNLEAAQISDALGQDPLFIALHDPINTPDTLQTIAQFVESSLQRLTAARGEYSAAEYGKALADLAKTMLLNREMEPSWLALLSWPALAGHAPALRHIVHQGDVIRLAGLSADEKLAFRHDRVREWLLAQAAFDLLRANAMPDEIAAEPYFAEVFGLALVREDALSGDISMIAARNPLALFCAVPRFREPTTSGQTTIVATLENWLGKTSVGMGHDRELRWEAMRVLGEAEGPSVRSLVARFDDNSWHALRARYRNGDLMGGVGLCLQNEPGVNVAGHDAFLDHVKARFGTNLVCALTSLLNNAHLNDTIRIGALRLAGHIGEPALADAIRTCWQNHGSRHAHLSEYLWACGQCVDSDPATLLGPICDEWTALSSENTDTGMPSPRDSLAAYNLRFAFHQRLSDSAVRYFIERAADPELKWPITYMLHGLDQPDAVEFVVRELAAITESLDGTDRFSPFVLSAKNDWENEQERSGRAMSEASRKRLRDIWQDQSTGKHLREQAFRIWSSTHRAGDLSVLRVVSSADVLADKVLWQRLRLGDYDAIPALHQKLLTDGHGYWWQLGRYIWSSDLSKALDEALERRRTIHATGVDNKRESGSDWILSEIVVSLPTNEADALLNKHWDHLCTSSYYVIAALSVATPSLRARVADTVRNTPDPKKLLKHFSMRFGLKRKGHPRLFRLEQIEAVVPYLDLLDELGIHDLWSACNDHGWFALRRAHLDSRFPTKMRGWAYLDVSRAMTELDEFSEKGKQWFIDHWIDDFLKTGALLDDVMALIGRWLKGKTDITSLQVACGAVLHVGERRHLHFLRGAKIEPAESAATIIANTEFGVRRRTLRT
ncbi:hypothetical protein [Paraburkholderia nemoris]|uniref:hypothetical protein n=1 Tax=Paraburkholderia nemoris TaxID=2793076 RepID=UPI001B2D897F|nr:hypothetical protein [Paraburkholderia nemoris]CAE6732681.1 hypothetical protein R75777_02143 [Paraburkholderia nemoris]